MRVKRFVLLGLVGILTVASVTCGGKSPTEPSPVCTAALTPGAVSFASDGGTGSIAVSIPAGCAWSATATGGWISVTAGGSGSGTGTVTYAVAANTSTVARSGSVTVAGQTHTVTQQGRPAASCTYEVSPTSARFDSKDAAAGTFSVSALAGCSWTARSSASWLSVTSGDSADGNGVVMYAVSRNLDIADRTATIAVADRTFTVTQGGDTGGCQYSVAPVDLKVCMAAGTLTATITTAPNCSWTANADASWLALTSGTSGTGSTTITVAVPDNYDAPRTGTILVRWPTPTQGQNIRVAQAGCRYAVSLSAFSFASTGGPGTFDVLQQSDPTECGGATQDRCVWTAVTDSPWITIAGSMPRSGDNPVSFVVAPNSGAVARIGTITVRDKTVTITQAGK